MLEIPNCETAVFTGSQIEYVYHGVGSLLCRFAKQRTDPMIPDHNNQLIMQVDDYSSSSVVSS